LGVSELKANLKPHNKTENLLPKIKEVMRSFDRNTMAKACIASGPGWRLSSQLMVVSLNMLIVNMYLC
jgi:hypothetical protein